MKKLLIILLLLTVAFASHGQSLRMNARTATEHTKGSEKTTRQRIKLDLQEFSTTTKGVKTTYKVIDHFCTGEGTLYEHQVYFVLQHEKGRLMVLWNIERGTLYKFDVANKTYTIYSGGKIRNVRKFREQQPPHIAVCQNPYVKNQ